MEDMANVSPISVIANKWIASNEYVEEIPLAKWYEDFTGRFIVEE